MTYDLTAEAIKSATLSLEGVHDVESCDSLPACVLSVGYCVSDDIFEEHFEDASGLLINKARDTLHATSSCETTDSGLRDALDVVS